MKTLFLLSLSLLLTTNALAQQGLQIGVRFNPEFTGYTSSNDAQAAPELQTTSHFTHLSFGAGAIYNIDENMGFGIDILFSREGQAYSGTMHGTANHPDAYSAVVARQASLNGVAIDGDYVALGEINYIKIPLMFSLTTDNTEPLFFTLLVGPQLNFLHGIAQEVNGEDLDYPTTNVTPNDLYNSFAVGVVLALGASYHLSSDWILSARFSFPAQWDPKLGIHVT